MTNTVTAVTRKGTDPGRRQRILEIARRDFEQLGFRKTSIDDVTREAGIAKGSFYLEFPSKDALLMAVVGQLREQATEYYTRRMAEAHTPTERVRTLLQVQ